MSEYFEISLFSLNLRFAMRAMNPLAFHDSLSPIIIPPLGQNRLAATWTLRVAYHQHAQHNTNCL